MRVREWHERITIECSARELPAVVAAISGQRVTTNNLYLTDQRQVYLTHVQTHQSTNLTRIEEYRHG